jgi:LysR family pca operon transcriptional activator
MLFRGGEPYSAGMEIDRRHLSYLSAVARHQSVTQAAQELGITQPALSRSIQEIERILGLRCFDRLAHGVVPTSACRVLLERADSLLGGFAELEREAQQLAGSFTGSLTVGLGPAIAAGSAVHEVALLIARHPKLEVRIVVEPAVDLMKRLQNFELDFFAGDQSLALDARGSCDFESIDYIARLFCRKTHPILRAKEPLSEVMRYPVAFVSAPALAVESMRTLLREGDPSLRPSWKPAVEIGSTTALETLLLGSDFLGASATNAHEASLRSGTLRIVPLPRPLYVGPVGPVRLRERALSPAAEALWKSIVEAIRIDIAAGAEFADFSPA